MPERVHLACAADARYVPHSAAAIHSMLAHADGLEVEIDYLHGPSLPARDRRRLAEMVDAGGASLRLLEIADEQVAGLPTMPEISSAMWYRIHLPELLADVGTVLYVDADTIAAGPLAPLWRTDLGDHLVGAVTNVFQADHFGRPAHLGLPKTASYFNSGVMLLNLEAMREARSADALRRVAIEQAERLDWPDQDALNLVLGERRLELHPRWNLMSSALLFEWAADVYGAEALAEAIADPRIRHFEGPSFAKPWHLLSDRPMRELYLEHRRATPWPRVRRTGVTPSNLARRALRNLRRH